MRGVCFGAIVAALMSMSAMASAQPQPIAEPVYEYMVDNVAPAPQSWWQRAERNGTASVQWAGREWSALVQRTGNAGVVLPGSIALAVLIAYFALRARAQAKSARALVEETSQTAAEQLRQAHAIRADAERKLARAEALHREAALKMHEAEVLARQSQSAAPAPAAKPPPDDDNIPQAGDAQALSALKSNAPRSTSDAAMLAGGTRGQPLLVNINDLLRGR